jgi:hypothetical protein
MQWEFDGDSDILKKSGIFDGFMGYIEDLFGIKQSVIGIG